MSIERRGRGSESKGGIRAPLQSGYERVSRQTPLFIGFGPPSEIDPRRGAGGVWRQASERPPSVDRRSPHPFEARQGAPSADIDRQGQEGGADARAQRGRRWRKGK